MDTEAKATPIETVRALIETANRRGAGIPIRHSFLQQGTGQSRQPGPLAELVRRGDQRALDLYLLLKAVTSAAPFDSHRGAKVWARALRHTGLEVDEVSISKTWSRLDRQHHLVRRSKHGRLANVTLLSEDGSGQPYVHPADNKDLYLQLPVIYWLDEEQQWCSTLSLPAKAILLIALSLKNNFVLPIERVPNWYGISADTAQRGIAELQKRHVLSAKTKGRKDPLAPEGITYERRFNLQGQFQPKWLR